MIRLGKVTQTNTRVEVPENFFKKSNKFNFNALTEVPADIFEMTAAVGEDFHSIITGNGSTAIQQKADEIERKFENLKDNNLEIILIKKAGYQNRFYKLPLAKGKEHNVNVKLEKIDTSLTIDSIPSGANITFLYGSNSLIPSGWPRTAKTPLTLKTTAKIAKIINTVGFSIQDVQLEGYNMKKQWGTILEPGAKKNIIVELKPVLTTVRIMSEPEGAIVEDITSGGFGYLGETPLTRNFTWEDIAVWAENKQVLRNNKNRGFESIELNLRLSKPGYKSVMMQRLKVPVGETRVFKRGLDPLSNKISFSSDPEGVHVYAQREIVQETYDEASGKISNKTVKFNQHMGTTLGCRKAFPRRN